MHGFGSRIVLGLGLLLLLCAGGLQACAAASSSGDDVSLDDLAAVSPGLRGAQESVRISKNPQRLVSGLKDLELPRVAIANATLKGGVLTSCSLPELRAENVTFDGVTFEKVRIREATLKNVRFINCVFKDTVIAKSSLENCLFQGGSFSRWRYGERDGANFESNEFRATTFDAVAFRNHAYFGNSKGDVTFRNITEVEGSKVSARHFFHGFGVAVVLEKCSFPEIDAFALWRESSLRATDCRFNGSRIWSGKTTGLFTNCTFTGPCDIGMEGEPVLKGCTIGAGLTWGPYTKAVIQ